MSTLLKISESLLDIVKAHAQFGKASRDFFARRRDRGSRGGETW